MLNTESTACAQVPFLEFDADVWVTNGDLYRLQDVGFELRLITRLQVYFVAVFPSLSDCDSSDS